MNYDEDLFNYIRNNKKYYNKEQLESNSSFMMKVIEITNNKKYYNNCSYYVRTDPFFVKYLINKFHDDIEFIKEVVNYYLIHGDFYEENYIEILVIYKLIVKNIETRYEEELTRIYEEDKRRISNYKKSDVILNQMLGLGFYYIIKKYDNNKIIKWYYATKFLDELCDQIIIKLHKKNKKYEDIDRINCFIINYVFCYDMYLGDYISINIEVLNGIKEKIKEDYDNHSNIIKFRIRQV